MNRKSGTSKNAADKLVKGIRRKTRKHYSAEEKIRIVLAGLRGEEVFHIAVTRRETPIAPNSMLNNGSGKTMAAIADLDHFRRLSQHHVSGIRFVRPRQQGFALPASHRQTQILEPLGVSY